MLTASIRPIHLSCMLGGVLTFLSCGSDPDDSPLVNRFGDSASTDLRSGVEAIRTDFAAVIEEFPHHPQAQSVFADLCRVAVRDGWAAGIEEAEQLLMQRYANGKIGIYAFDMNYGRLPDTTSGARLAYARGVYTDLAGTSVAARALDRELEILSSTDPDLFLSTCSEILDSESPSDREVRLILARRGRYYRDSGNTLAGALDLLRFSVEYPEVALSLNLAYSAVASLREAGFILEADIFAADPLDSVNVRWIYDRLSAVARRSSIYSGASLRPASDERELIENIEQQPVPASFESVISIARLARRASYDRNTRLCADHLEELLDQIPTLLSDSGTELEVTDLQILFMSLDALSANAGALSDRTLPPSVRGGGAGRNDSETDLKTLTSELRKTRRDVGTAWTAAASALTPEVMSAATDAVVERLTAMNDRRSVIEAYSRFLEHFPDSPHSPAYSLDVAQLYEKEWHAPSLALSSYQELIERYPDSPQARRAMIHQSRLLYADRKYADALFLLEEFLATYPPDAPDSLLANFMAAMCEGSLNMHGEAERRVLGIVAEHPLEEMAERALYWLALQELARTDYEGAEQHIRDFLARYPESEYASEAKSVLQSLGRRSNTTSN